MSTGSKFLIINGHTFRKEISVNGATTRWCCIEPCPNNCDVYAHVNDKFELVCIMNTHNHEPTLCQVMYETTEEMTVGDDVILFLESYNRRTIMQYGGYQYHKGHKTKLGVRWKCTTKNCMGFVFLNDYNEIITTSVSHNHDPPSSSEPHLDSDDNDTAIVITSRKGKEMLLFRNYTYRRQYDKANKTRWVCSTQKNCRAVVFTDSSNVITSVFEEHEHDPPKYYLNHNHVMDALRDPILFESLKD